MIVNVLIVVVLIALVVLLAVLARRAWRSRRALVRWPGMILAGLLALILGAVTVVVGLGYFKLNVAPNTYSVSPVKVALTPEKIARGERLAYICSDCHSSTGKLPLDGGKEDMMASVPMPFGTIWATNLTPGGPLKDWSDGEIVRAIREGINRQGRPLIVMTSVAFRNLSDTDAEALVAYLRSQPAVSRSLPERSLSPLAAAFVGLGMLPTSAQAPVTAPIAAPPPGTPEYGRYLTKALGCTDCHGLEYAGIAPGFIPSGSNLTLIVPKWSQADFLALFRKGTDPSGRLLGETMPWKSYDAALTDSELTDMYNFLHTLAPRETVGR